MKCSYCNSDKRVYFNLKHGDYLCNKHYMQFYHTGIIKDRFRNDPNDIIIYTDYAEIILCDKNGNETARAVIDIEDVNRCENYKWSRHGKGYVQTEIGENILFLHNLIMNNNDKNIISDHIDHNKLNNQKNNLRLCTYSQNNMNSVIPSNNTSGVKGVSYYKRDNIWEAYIAKDGKRVYHQKFKTIDEAILNRKKWEQELFGEFNYA